MSVGPQWLPDPQGAHQLRYWDGTAWSEHVSDHQVTGRDPLPSDVVFPAPEEPGAAPAGGDPGDGGTAATDATAVEVGPITAVGGSGDAVETGGGGGRGWKGKLKKAAETATSQGKVLAEKAKTQIGDHQAKRLEQWRTDPATRWTGESRTVASKAGVPAAIYRVTAEALWIESGLLGSKSEHVPLAQVADVDVRVGVLQRSKDIGDVVLRVEDTSGSRITGEVVVDNIEGPHHLRDLLLPLIGEARAQRIVERGNQFFPDELTDEPAGGSDLIDQLERLGQLRDAGVLTEEEFAAQKSRLLGG